MTRSAAVVEFSEGSKAREDTGRTKCCRLQAVHRQPAQSHPLFYSSNPTESKDPDLCRMEDWLVRQFEWDPQSHCHTGLKNESL